MLTPLNPTFIKKNRDLQGYTLFFLISAQKHRLWVLVRTASPVLSRNMKNIGILSENSQFLVVKFSVYLNRRVFVMAYLAIQSVPSEDSDKTTRIGRLICIFAGRTCPTVFSTVVANMLETVVSPSEKSKTRKTVVGYLTCKILPLFYNNKSHGIWRFLTGVNAIHTLFVFVLRFYGPVNPMGSCRARSVYLSTRLLGRLSPLSG